MPENEHDRRLMDLHNLTISTFSIYNQQLTRLEAAVQRLRTNVSQLKEKI